MDPRSWKRVGFGRTAENSPTSPPSHTDAFDRLAAKPPSVAYITVGTEAFLGIAIIQQTGKLRLTE